ncbi:MAG: hypothetical protein HQL31_12075 [Planctomycetes bacterium]|nr:hypothetical protein [Planctomycetota bacterium]
MKTEFRQDEMVEKRNKDGSTTRYPVVGGRLRVAHDENEKISVLTELVQFTPMEQAAMKATITTDRGSFSAYGAASASKDARLVDSLLELAETRAIARALRFAGYGVEFTGVEEISESQQSSPTANTPPSRPMPVKSKPVEQDFAGPTRRESGFTPLTRAQKHAIETIATVNKWNTIECCRRILGQGDIHELDDLSKDEASTVISKMKAKIAA